MAQQTLLEIANSIALQIRFNQIKTVFGNNDKNVATIFDAIKSAAEIDVFRAHMWAVLQREFVISYDGSTYYILPLEFDYIVNDTDWDVLNSRKGFGGMTPYDFQAIKYAQIAPPSDRPTWQQTVNDFGTGLGIRRCIEFFPVPAAMPTPGDPSFSFIYMSKWYALDGSTNEPKEAITSDGDTYILDTHAIEKGALVRMLRTLGLSFQSEQEEFQAIMKDRKAKDQAMRDIDTTGGRAGLYGYPNTPGYVPRGFGYFGGRRF